LYHEMQRLAREFTPRATEILRDIADDPSEDSRNRIVAIGMLYDRAWGRAPDYDPAKDPDRKPRPVFDPRAYSPDELEQIETVLRLLMEPRTAAADPERLYANGSGQASVVVPPAAGRGGTDQGV
jgi:hypothetical protein